MKTFLLTLFLIQTIILSAQNTTLGVIYAPTDKGVGIRYDKQIRNIGIYGSVSRGNYWVYDYGQICSHLKVSTGFVKYVPNKTGNVINLFSVGINYNSYGTIKKDYIPKPDHLFFPVSLELGVGVIYGHFNIGWCYDPFKKEVTVNSGLYFDL